MPAANRYTTTELLASIRRTGHIPPSQTPFQDTDLLAFADYECQTALLRQIKTARENFYLVYDDLTVNTEGLYNIPTRAVGEALQDIHIVSGTQIYTVGRSETNEQFSTVTSPTGFWSYQLIGSQIQILPTTISGVVRLWYLRRPNTLVPVASAAQVTGVSSTVLTFASGTLPSTVTASSSLDCIADQPHFDWRFVDKTPTAVSSTTVTFSSLPTDQYGAALIQVGDWIALAGQTPVPQVPVEFTPLLIQRTVVKYYEAQNYKDRVEVAQKKLEEMEKDVFELINPRVSSEPKRIVPDSNIIGGFRRWRSWRAT